jgi:hypothetical protein
VFKEDFKDVHKQEVLMKDEDDWNESKIEDLK